MANEAARVDPDKELYEAFRAFEAGRLDIADALVRRVLSVAPRSAQAHFAFGMIAAAAGNLPLAIERMREALRHQPGLQPATERLADLHLQAGNLTQATKFAQLALLSNPDCFECHMVLGQCHGERGDLAAALESFTRAASARPDVPDGHLAMGRTLRQSLRVTEAEAALREAVRVFQSADAFEELAELLTFVGNLEGAVEVYQQALAAFSDRFEFWILLGRALTDLGRLPEADDAWNRAEAVEPAPGQARLAQALSLILVGHFEDAQGAAKQSLLSNPIQGKPHHILFNARRMVEADRLDVERLEDLLKRGDLRDNDRIDLRFALGKAYDDLGEYELAIGHFDVGNSLLRRLSLGDNVFDRAAFSQSVDDQIRRYPASVLRSVRDDGPELPLFVMGMLRSGTTLVDQILSCHSQVGSAGEHGFWLHHEKLVLTGSAEVKQRLKADYVGLLRSLAPGCTQVIDKNPANVLVAGLLHTVFPSSRILCTRRHAVDTALSIWMTQTQTNASFVGNRSDIVFAYKEFLRLTDHWREAMPEDRYREVRYESLIEAPEAVTRSTVEFCGLDWEDACLRPEANERTIKTPSFWQVRQPVFRTSVDRWKRYEPWLGEFSELVGL